MDQQIILASSSPYRKQILDRTGLIFTTVSPDIDESPLLEESPRDLVKRLAELKAREVQSRFPEALIIGSDQVAELGGRIIGKPRNHDDAVSQLRQSSASLMTLYAGVALLNSASGNLQTAVDSFAVEYRELSDDQIYRYLESAQPYDSCGSLKAEGIGIALLKRLSGNDPNTLMGLPLIKLIEMLQCEGVVII
jgi:MAF protein